MISYLTTGLGEITFQDIAQCVALSVEMNFYLMNVSWKADSMVMVHIVNTHFVIMISLTLC